MRCDLHMHSTVSDGSLPVRDLVRAVHAADVQAFALTDHDCIDGWPAVREEAERLALQTLPGVEISTRGDTMELHILGYGFDPDDRGLRELFEELQSRRRERIPAIVERMRELGVPLELDDVLARAGSGSAGRPHVAQALVAAGHCPSVGDAFERFLGERAPAHVRKAVPRPEEAISALHAAGGLAVWAHPCARQVQRPGGLAQLVSELARAGLDGLEVIHPSHTPAQRKRLRRLARENELLTTGGSDFHGDSTPDVRLGSGRSGDSVPIEHFEALLRSGSAVC